LNYSRPGASLGPTPSEPNIVINLRSSYDMTGVQVSLL